MFKRKHQSQISNRKRFRIFASSEDQWLADIWAVDESDAREKAENLNPRKFRGMTSEWNVDKIRAIEPRDLQFEPFRPVN